MSNSIKLQKHMESIQDKIQNFIDDILSVDLDETEETIDSLVETLRDDIEITILENLNGKRYGTPEIQFK